MGLLWLSHTAGARSEAAFYVEDAGLLKKAQARSLKRLCAEQGKSLGFDVNLIILGLTQNN